MRHILLPAALLLTTALPSFALTVTVESVVASVNLNGSSGSDFVLSNSLPVAVATASISGEDDIEGQAFQNQNGVSYVRAGSSSSFGGSSGSDTQNVATASTFIEYLFLNDGPNVVAPIFNYNVSNIRLTTLDTGNEEKPEAQVIFFAVSSGGASSTNSAKLVGRITDGSNPPMATGDISGTTTPTEPAGSGRFYGAEFVGNPFSGTLSVGAIAPGQSKTVRVGLFAEAKFFGVESGSYAQIWDPNGGPSFGYSLTFAQPSAVPLPASGLLLLAGLGGLALRLRKRG